MTRSGRLAVVTGASSGIGAAVAVALGGRGYRVVLVARTEKRLLPVRDRIEAAGAVGICAPCDAADGQAVLEMAARIRGEHGVPDVIVNSAGAGVWRFIEETAPDEAVQMMGAPYLAAYNTTHAFMADMLARRSGVIVHVGSPASRIPWPGATGYVAARWALRGLHEALCLDLRGTGIHSVHVVFGKVTTDYFANNPGSEERIPQAGLIIPVITPEDCARVILEAIDKPRKEVVYPFALKLFYWMEAVMPGFTRSLTALTGHRH